MTKTENTLYVMVTCAREESRHNVLVKSVENLLETFSTEMLGNLIVFDNDSTGPSRDLLKMSFQKLYLCDKNVGYWTALNWLLKNYEVINGRTYDFVHVIESDQLYFDVSKFELVEKFLIEHSNMGGCKIHEYSVANKHLYDKGLQYPESKRHDWIQHTNPVTGKEVKLIPVAGYDDLFFESNFAIQVTNVLRLDALKRCFDSLNLTHYKGFSETDLRAVYYQLYQKIAVLDGGIHSKKESHFEYVKVITGSHSSHDELKKYGYRMSAVDHILKSNEFSVVRA